MWVPSLGMEDPLEEDMETPPVFLPRESHGQRSLEGYSPQCHKESDMHTCNRNHMLNTKWQQPTSGGIRGLGDSESDSLVTQL